MILDYKFNSRFGKFTVSYINQQGQKSIADYNVNKFKTYYYTPTGKFMSDTGAKCDIKWTERPHKFDLWTFFRELPKAEIDMLQGSTLPKLYTFDIENEFEKGSKADPANAPYPIVSIQVTSPNLNTIVFGTRPVDEAGVEWINGKVHDYLKANEFFNNLHQEVPTFKYMQFETEEEMIRYFLQNIVAKVAILAGWNCIQYDWQYIVNRIKNNYPQLSVNLSSCKKTVHNARYIDMRGDTIILPMPDHTLIIDYMDFLQKENSSMFDSFGLDFVASKTVQANKIEYEGDLMDLLNKDFKEYLYYGSVDAILVQLIDKKLRQLDHIYMYSLYCKEKIGSCFSKIATTEAQVYEDFYQHGLKIVPEERTDIERGKLMGAYVKKPIPGIHEYVCCNDFASLYPSTIRTCNLSFENYVGAFWKNDILKKYSTEINSKGLPMYVLIGPNVYINISKKPGELETGDYVGTFNDDEKLEVYRKDPNYFVSVNGCVYKNDRDYCFRRIQARLKANRDSSKYLAKKLDAAVISDIEHILHEKSVDREYDEESVEVLAKLGYTIHSSKDFTNYTKEQIVELNRVLKLEIDYLTLHEQSMKLLMNSMYGGSSHVSFYWFNMNLPNDITGESRNLTHMMEHYIPKFMRDNWVKLTDVHKSLGIEVNPEQAQKALMMSPIVTEEQDKDAFHDHSFVYAAYGDTDSIYSSYKYFIMSITGYENFSLERIRDIVVRFNTGFLDAHNREFIADYYAKRHGKSVHNFELETFARSGVWLEVKKRYAQILMWKDGKEFDIDNLPMKVKGLEIVKSSYPPVARKILSHLTRFLLENSGTSMLPQKINKEIQMHKNSVWMSADIEDICGNINIKGINYQKYIETDTGAQLVTRLKCPFNVRALGNYNFLRNKNNLTGEPIYMGKMKWYIFSDGSKLDYFAYRAMEYPKWADTYAPINRSKMYEHFVIDPFNRIIEGVDLPKFNENGCFQVSLSLF